MVTLSEAKKRLEKVFEEDQAEVLAATIIEAYDSLVKTSDFNELKEIVRELAEAQKRTEVKVEELAEAQKETQRELSETQQEIRRLTYAIRDTRSELGGLSRSVAYSLENEAFRALPSYFKRNLQIEVTKKFIRTQIDKEEINIFGMGRKDGRNVIIVGEAELRLTSTNKFRQLEKKVSVVKKKYKKEEIVQILITHYAPFKIMEEAKKKGITIIQSFEW